MVKQIKKLTALLFVAATMFTFVSCNKDDDNSISEASLVGEWGYQSSHTLAGKTMVFTDNNIVKYDGKDYTWQINKKHLRGVYRERFIIEFDIVEFDGTTMKISGTVKDSIAQMSGAEPTDISGTLVKTVTYVPTSLDESMMPGQWRCDISFNGIGVFGLTVKEDHTCVGWYGYMTFDWSIKGKTFISNGGYTSDNYGIAFTPDSITTSATKIIMYVRGTNKHHKHDVLAGTDEDTTTEFAGKITKNL